MTTYGKWRYISTQYKHSSSEVSGQLHAQADLPSELYMQEDEKGEMLARAGNRTAVVQGPNPYLFKIWILYSYPRFGLPFVHSVFRANAALQYESHKCFHVASR